jgi:hypothetical protein
MPDIDTDNQTTNSTGAGDPGGDPGDRFTDQTITPEEMAPVDTVGQLIETFISPRDFASLEWCHANVSSQPAGYHVVVGRIAGYATNGEERESGLRLKPGEKAPPPSFWARGQFEAVALATGEVKTAPWLILPRSAGELLKQAFAGGTNHVLLDLEIGLQATGKAIPYRWTVRAYGGASGEAQRIVAGIRARQEARAKAPRLARNGAALTLEHAPSEAAERS